MKSRAGTRGQGLTEYILIVALMAIAAIGVVTLLGDNVRKLFGQAAEALTGNPDVSNDAVHRRKDLEEKTLQGFGGNNAYR
ncbi:MAG TPA: Flp family type IVb pilin [Myxococcaceae bacterium]|nr:Flp family type IVb pilin [Myxococcaceae bacterium]